MVGREELLEQLDIISLQVFPLTVLACIDGGQVLAGGNERAILHTIAKIIYRSYHI